MFYCGNGRAWAVRRCLAAFLALGLFACAGATEPAGTPTSSTAATSAASPLLAALSTATMPAVLPTGTQPGPQPSQTAPATTVTPTGPLQALQAELALANREMNAARTSDTLADAQQHAQAAVNTLVGAWGRWYDVNGFVDPSDRRGVFPGERVPGPAKDSPTDLTPIGWGIRAYDGGGPTVQPAVQTVMGDVKLWRTNPRSRYDEIERSISGTVVNRSQVSKLDGHAMRALAYARLIVAKASSLDEARQYAALGSTEIGAALTAVQSLP